MFTLHAKKNYDEVIDRSRTIAAFCVAQGIGDPLQLGYRPMRRDVLIYLIKQSAVNHWLNTVNRLEKTDKSQRSSSLRLTEKGLKEVRNNLAGGGTIGASVGSVKEWIEQSLNGGVWTDDEPKPFEGELLPSDSGPMSLGDARRLVVEHYLSNKGQYPKTVSSKRDEIAAKVIEGIRVEDAFKDVLEL